MDKTKQQGYVLVIVLILAFLMATTITAAFTVVHRYYRLAKRDIEQLRTDVLAEESFSVRTSDMVQEDIP